MPQSNFAILSRLAGYSGSPERKDERKDGGGGFRDCTDASKYKRTPRENEVVLMSSDTVDRNSTRKIGREGGLELHRCIQVWMFTAWGKMRKNVTTLSCRPGKYLIDVCTPPRSSVHFWCNMHEAEHAPRLSTYTRCITPLKAFVT